MIMTEPARRARRLRALEDIRQAQKIGIALAVLRRFEEAVRDEDFEQAAGACRRASPTAPAWMNADLDQRALEDAERRVISAALALDGAAGADEPPGPIIAEHNDACLELRRLRRQSTRGAR